MKSNAIIRIVIWSIVLIALVSIFVFMLFPWLLRNSVLHDTPPTENTIPLSAATSPGQFLTGGETLTFPADSIREIEIEWRTGDLIFLVSDENVITVSESDVEDPEYAMVIHTDDHKLEIAYCEESLNCGLDIAGKIPKKDLYIHVPKDWVCDSLEIDVASASLEIHDWTIREMDFDGASGTGDFQNCHISDLDIDTASGDVYYAGTLESLDFDAASASFIADFRNTPSRIDMDGMSGCLDIALPEDCGFTLNMNSTRGRFVSDFQSTARKNNSQVYGDGRCLIHVDGMRCDVTIRKLDAVPATVDPAT